MKKAMVYLNNLNPLIIVLLIFSLLGCNKDAGNTNTPNADDSTPNILLIIADDIGKDAINGFSEGSIKPNTPNIDAIRNDGLSFSNFWSYPTCSPTRASILTGKYGYRTGVKWAGDELDLSETSLQKYISDQTDDSYASAIVGKWHLSGSNGTFNPEIFGIDYYSGLIRGSAQSYYNWLLTEDGAGTLETKYSTQKFTNLAIDWIDQQDKPWFMWLAYNAPHTPFHVPPSEMHSQGNLPDYVDGMDEMPYYMAAIEALDFQIGRLLNNISDEELQNTVIIFMGDNGSPNQVAQFPYSNNSAKGTLYQGGINVPLFISGKGVSRIGIDDNLVASTDLFATISEIAGISLDEINDSKSFKSLLSEDTVIRNFQYSEKNNGSVDNWAISNGVYKLIENSDGDKELYDLGNDPYEQDDLLNGTLSNIQSIAKEELETELLNIRQ